MPPPILNNKENIYWIVGILIKGSYITAKKLSKYLLKHGIQTRPFFYPMNKQPILKKYFKKNIKYKNSQYLSKYGLYLPSGLGLSKNQINYICNKLNSFLK